jgi:hypothetical protein
MHSLLNHFGYWLLMTVIGRTGAALVNYGPLIILIGGYKTTEGNDAYASCECYNTQLKRWMPFDSFPSLKEARRDAHALVIHGTIYVMGGRCDLSTHLTTVEILNRKKKQWEYAAW